MGGDAIAAKLGVGPRPLELCNSETISSVDFRLRELRERQASEPRLGPRSTASRCLSRRLIGDFRRLPHLRPLKAVAHIFYLPIPT